MTTILITDDDPNIHQLLSIYLENEGFQVLSAFHGEEAMQVIQKEEVDLVILDTMMPKMDGYTACMKIREIRNMPIIFLTAKSENLDVIQGLTIGADDYMTKPFQPLELVARVKSQLRRYHSLQGSTTKTSSEELVFDNLVINRKTHQVERMGQKIELTRREFAILELLARNHGIVFSIEEIYEKVWKETFINNENTVMVHIRNIRAKLEDQPKKPKYIHTIWGVGYKFQSE
ncbi:DNA-binding response regulator, OmpR family, contains REC and winged-helix (wHTH) domain [Seinonella peptonophila]|uniref:DNA-binding response regulator, OmpR family, contains REC and winged-helix (WHTH) domain n=1 Tax=Seinonella peptonophila TaxID=112248 RepID=A0A1M4WEJ1_9BACL|nr:response regulator transcription factor [Seinonella peptonophila]SHE79493.1 DNA-binding response regulator, OmpR family, contains REC and winged-helix (wHTH) domain [Seinonella peptonophila]